MNIGRPQKIRPKLLGHPQFAPRLAFGGEFQMHPSRSTSPALKSLSPRSPIRIPNALVRWEVVSLSKPFSSAVPPADSRPSFFGCSTFSAESRTSLLTRIRRCALDGLLWGDYLQCSTGCLPSRSPETAWTRPSGSCQERKTSRCSMLACSQSGSPHGLVG